MTTLKRLFNQGKEEREKKERILLKRLLNNTDCVKRSIDC